MMQRAPNPQLIWGCSSFVARPFFSSFSWQQHVNRLRDDVPQKIEAQSCTRVRYKFSDDITVGSNPKKYLGLAIKEEGVTLASTQNIRMSLLHKKVFRRIWHTHFFLIVCFLRSPSIWSRERSVKKTFFSLGGMCSNQGGRKELSAMSRFPSLARSGKIHACLFGDSFPGFMA